jgi:hypothetical protein
VIADECVKGSLIVEEMQKAPTNQTAKLNKIVEKMSSWRRLSHTHVRCRCLLAHHRQSSHLGRIVQDQ